MRSTACWRVPAASSPCAKSERTGPEPWRDFAPIWTRFYGDRQAVNLGFKGDSTCHLLWRIENGELNGIRPRGIVLLIGANNFGHVHADAAQTFDGILLLLEQIHARLPDTHILLLGVLPSIRSRWVDENTLQLNRRLAAQIVQGRSYVAFMNIGDLFEQHGRVDPSRFLDPKLVPPDPPLHPTAQSQEQIARRIEPAVAQMLGDRIHD